MSWKRSSIHQGRVGDFGLETGVLPNGLQVTLEILRHPGAAAVVPLDSAGNVTLIRQYRHAAGGFILELPAGKLEIGELPEVCAARELEEEAGVRAEKLELLMPLLTTPAFTDEVIYLYLATGLTEVAIAHEEDEVIEILKMPLAEAVERVVAGEIRDGKSICGLMLAWYKLNS
jgi:ADP-ribose pyrophosphatase